jgi:hypothetical protein
MTGGGCHHPTTIFQLHDNSEDNYTSFSNQIKIGIAHTKKITKKITKNKYIKTNNF